ncbi:acyl carrier protein [Neptunomonas phycophila]|uniref:Acyl carrier protein n=1 Tax=Neptunomonas phycophila TaxID=1572645 RepID=A0AAW7XMF1_9GAMM|nr:MULTISPECIES: acyl carrier protein [Neptunomonas]MDN2661190.1 acyl carrier protein [Neptunomonas sp. CHC150]MDO6454474.1 acyl carrier protein [Neptunomonas phycophila]MDO6467155.1 acyl carrier protein [Neptunomonas phycophila]MDP2521926.1 acyl carrier protein [Neptunomonas phycophila]QLE96843.1 acyl carrier protein [Neptunomonas phycophila]
MVAVQEIVTVLDSVLQLGDRAEQFDESTALLGSIPEFDSMAVVMVIGALEDNYGFVVDDDEMSADIFETVGALQQFVNAKLA